MSVLYSTIHCSITSTTPSFRLFSCEHTEEHTHQPYYSHISQDPLFCNHTAYLQEALSAHIICDSRVPYHCRLLLLDTLVSG